MLTTFKATATKLPEGLQVATEARSFKILFDEPAELGGTDKGLNPVEGLLVALGACQSIVAAAFAESQGFKLEGFRVELEGDLDPDGFLGVNPNVRNGFSEVRYKMIFKTSESQEKAEAFSKFIENSCPVGDTLSVGTKLVKAGVVVE